MGNGTREDGLQDAESRPGTEPAAPATPLSEREKLGQAVLVMRPGQRAELGDLTVDRVPGGWLYTIQRVGTQRVLNPVEGEPPLQIPFSMQATSTFVADPDYCLKARELRELMA